MRCSTISRCISVAFITASQVTYMHVHHKSCTHTPQVTYRSKVGTQESRCVIGSGRFPYSSISSKKVKIATNAVSRSLAGALVWHSYCTALLEGLVMLYTTSISKHISFSAVSYIANTFLGLQISGAPIKYSNLHKTFKQLQHGSVRFALEKCKICAIEI